jgi:hypothetical protein
VVDNYYSSGCSNCAADTAGAAAIGLAAGAALGAAAESSDAAAATGSAYAAGEAAGAAASAAAGQGGAYTTLPANCVYKSVGGANDFQCGSMWLTPAFGANGQYYKVIPPPQ